MTARTCQTCKHYEPSAMWRRGWCRNPRLYSPQQSHLVDQDSLDCNRGLGHAWEPIDGEASGEGPAPAVDRQPLRLFAPQPRLAAAGIGMMASSGFDSGGDGGNPPPPTGPQRPDRPPAPGGQERTVSFQPEERYWTDYLRIALPAIGLILLVVVFWYWAGALIGDDDGGGDEQATEVMLADIPDIDASPTAPTSSPVPSLAPSPGAPPAAAPPTPTPASPTPTPEPAETASASTCGANATTTYEAGQTVVTNANVNMRQEASTASEVVEELDAGTELEIRGEFVDGGEGECDWWPVELPATGQAGFIREDLLQPAGGGQ